METTKFLDLDCVVLENSALTLLVTRSVGPRIISLRLNGGANLFAELPDFVTKRPDGRLFHFLGGHRLWHAPENMPRTYQFDDKPVEISMNDDGLVAVQPVESLTGIEKSLQVSLVGEKPQVLVCHTLTNHGAWPVETAPWAISQLKPGGTAILPQSRQETGLLPNRSLVLWPYTDLGLPQVTLGRSSLLVRAAMKAPFKLGFPNPRGWLAYFVDGTLFVKRAPYFPQARYYDSGCSSECYVNERFLELETHGPVTLLGPEESVSHTETWELHSGIPAPEDELAAEAIAERLGLE